MPKSQTDGNGQEPGATEEKKPKKLKRGGDRPGSRLTNQQLHFIEEYLQHFNATRAAKDSGYSEKSAYVSGYQLLQNPLVKSEIEKRRLQTREKFRITVDNIVDELARYGFKGHPQAYYDAEPSDRLKALKDLGKHIGMWGDKNNGSTSDFGTFFAGLLGQAAKARGVRQQPGGADGEDGSGEESA